MLTFLEISANFQTDRRCHLEMAPEHLTSHKNLMIFHNDAPNSHVPAFLEFLVNALSTTTHSKFKSQTLEIFLFPSNKYQKMDKMRTRTEIVNPCINCIKHTKVV